MRFSFEDRFAGSSNEGIALRSAPRTLRFSFEDRFAGSSNEGDRAALCASDFALWAKSCDARFARGIFAENAVSGKNDFRSCSNR